MKSDIFFDFNKSFKILNRIGVWVCAYSLRESFSCLEENQMILISFKSPLDLKLKMEFSLHMWHIYSTIYMKILKQISVYCIKISLKFKLFFKNFLKFPNPFKKIKFSTRIFLRKNSKNIRTALLFLHHVRNSSYFHT